MNAGQIRLYRFEVAGWVKACRKLNRPCDDDARRALHAAVAAPASSKDFSQDDLTRVIARMRSFSQPGNFTAQMNAQVTLKERLLEEIAGVQVDCQIKGGVEGLARYFNKWLGGRAITALDEETLEKLLGILKRRRDQLAKEAVEVAAAPTAEDDGDPF